MTRQMLTMRKIVSVLSILLLQLRQAVNATLLEEPNLRWTFTLQRGGQLSGRGLRKGNAIVPHKGGDKLFVTADDGSLHILQLAGSPDEEPTATVFEPDPVSNRYTECRSGGVVVDGGNDSDDYLVYAVLDTPTLTKVQVTGGILLGRVDQGALSSRVIAVNLDGTLRWSLTVQGAIQGSPVVGSSNNIYISRNVDGKGYLSVILIASDGSAEVTASLAPTDRGAPFGPPSLRAPALDENSQGDIVAVAESWDDGYTERGSVYILTPSPEFMDWGGKGIDSYQLQQLSQWPFSVVSAPVISGTSVYVGGQGANLAGWTGTRDLTNLVVGGEEDFDPRWSIGLTPSERNASQPLLNTPVATRDGSLIFLPGASNDVLALQTETGRELWSDSIGGTVLSKPVLFESEVGSVLYVIESLGGTVVQHDVSDGSRIWQYRCEDAACQGGVEADFGLAPSGNVLYYGDIFGRITALQVAAFETEAPTASPTATETSSPTLQPTETTVAPTGSPSIGQAAATVQPSSVEVVPPTSEPPSIFETDGSTSGLEAEDNDSTDGGNSKLVTIVSSLAGVLVVVCVGALLFARSRRSKKGKSTDEEGMEELDDVASEDLEEEREKEMEVTVSSDAVEVEMLAGIAVYSPKNQKIRPSRKKKKTPKKPRTPPTPLTLESIEEIPEIVDEATGKDSNSAVASLQSKFDFIAEVGSEDMSTDDESNGNPGDDDDDNGGDEFSFNAKSAVSGSDDGSYAMSIEAGDVGQSRDGTHLELSVGNNKLKRIASEVKDDASAVSALSDDKSRSLESPLPHVASGIQNEPPAIQEEKKESEDSEKEEEAMKEPAKIPVSPILQYDTDSSSCSSEEHKISPNSNHSNGSSVYTNGTSPTSNLSFGKNRRDLSPLSPHIIGKGEAEDMPDDEARGGRTFLIDPLATKGNQRSLADSDSQSDAPDDELVHAPGSHYMKKSSPPFLPKSLRQSSDEPSAVAGNPKYGKSVRKARGSAFENTDSDSDQDRDYTRSIYQMPPMYQEPETKPKPTFKRRSKREEQAQKALEKSAPQKDDPWSSFLKDLSDAEQSFFEPPKSQTPTQAKRISLLQYDSEESSDDSGDSEQT